MGGEASMGRLIQTLFQDDEHAKMTIAVGGTVLAAIGFIVVLVAVSMFR